MSWKRTVLENKVIIVNCIFDANIFFPSVVQKEKNCSGLELSWTKCSIQPVLVQSMGDKKDTAVTTAILYELIKNNGASLTKLHFYTPFMTVSTTISYHWNKCMLCDYNILVYRIVRTFGHGRGIINFLLYIKLACYFVSSSNLHCSYLFLNFTI